MYRLVKSRQVADAIELNGVFSPIGEGVKVRLSASFVRPSGGREQIKNVGQNRNVRQIWAGDAFMYHERRLYKWIT